MNHHFRGDISAWFVKCIAGIRLNPGKHDVNTVQIRPSFIGLLSHASAYHVAPAGKISVWWKREGQEILLDVKIPEAVRASVVLERGFCFADGPSEKTVATGTYKIISRPV